MHWLAVWGRRDGSDRRRFSDAGVDASSMERWLTGKRVQTAEPNRAVGSLHLCLCVGGLAALSGLYIFTTPRRAPFVREMLGIQQPRPTLSRCLTQWPQEAILPSNSYRRLQAPPHASSRWLDGRRRAQTRDLSWRAQKATMPMTNCSSSNVSSSYPLVQSSNTPFLLLTTQNVCRNARGPRQEDLPSHRPLHWR